MPLAKQLHKSKTHAIGLDTNCPICVRLMTPAAPVPPEETFTSSEISAVRELNDYLDQSPDAPHDSVPDAERLIRVAWWLTEEWIREQTGKCSGTHTRKDEHAPETQAPFTCQCCRYFHDLTRFAARVRSML